jgi:P-type Cu2+ transporter
MRFSDRNSEGVSTGVELEDSDSHPERYDSTVNDDATSQVALSNRESVKVAGNASSVPCAHCGLPSPPPVHDDEPAFCCNGCLGAYQLIHGWGLADYYALRDRLSSAGVSSSGTRSNRPSSGADDEFEELDHTELLGLSAPRAVGGGLVASSCSVRGLHCGACAWLIERSVPLVPGWHSARVRMNDHSVELIYDPTKTRLSEIARWMARLGYRVGPMVDNARGAAADAENRRLLVRIAIAAFCAMNAMWIAVALYAGHFSGISVGHANLFRLFGSALGVAAVFGPGSLFIRGALAAIWTRTPHMDLPLALALVVGAVAGIIGAITGRGEVFFDSITMLVFLLLVGRWVQFRQQRRAAESVHLLMQVAPRTAQIVDPDGSIRKISAADLVVGDRIRVDAGQGIPADGLVVAGETAIDRSLLTGESVPVDVIVGDVVEAGTANLQSPIDIKVSAAGVQSRVGRLMQLVEDAAANKAPVVQLADRVGGWFVVVVIFLSLVTALIWWPSGSAIAITHAVALLIVACPCALALATPLALAVGIGRAARQRIFVRGGDCFERLATPGTVWFDKTGTLTKGQLSVTHWPGDRDALGLVAAIERGSAHPVAKGIVAYAEQCGSARFDATQIDQQTGGGISGMVDGRRVIVGKTSFLKSQGIDFQAIESEIERVAEAGASPILYAIDNAAPKVFGVADSLRDDAAESVKSLRKLGWRVGILSGDHPQAVARIASALRIESTMALGDLSPEQKLRRIEASDDNGPVVMVGDGVNDSAALAAADVGVAIRGGAETSLDAAPVFLADAALGGLVKLMVASRDTVRLIHRTFAVSLAYNLVAVALAMAGMVHPLTAALIMPASSLTVLTMILATATFREGDQ